MGKNLYQVSRYFCRKANEIVVGFQNIVVNRELAKVGSANAQSISTHLSKRELSTLYGLARELGISARALEIGSYLGASSCYLAAALGVGNGHLFCVDTWENQTMPDGERDTFGEFQMNTRGITNRITPIRKNSLELKPSDFQEQQFNLVFIDGDHSYRGVKNDFEKVASWVVGGGILAFHDCIAFEGVARTIGEALASGCWKFGGQVDNLLWLYKVKEGLLEFEHPAL